MDHRLPVLQYEAEPEAVSVQGSAASTNTAAAKQQTQPKAKPNRSNAAKSSKSGKRDDASSCSSKADQENANSSALQELSKERRKRAFIGMLKLLDHGAKDAQELQVLVAAMSHEELLQVAEERALAGKCGNPLCTQLFVWQEPRQKYRAVADNIHKVEGDSYCSKACASFVRALAAQLVHPLSRIKPHVFEEYLARPSHRPKQGVAAQGGGVPTMKCVIQERDPFQLIHEAEEAGRQLEAAAAQQRGDSEASAAVEGFVPRNTPIKQPAQQKQQPDGQAQQQQQQQPDSCANGEEQQEPMEVLQLQPALPRLAASAAAAAVTGAGGNASAADKANGTAGTDSYLTVFKEHQDRQLLQIYQQEQYPVDISSAGEAAMAAAAAAEVEPAADGTSSCSPACNAEGRSSNGQPAAADDASLSTTAGAAAEAADAPGEAGEAAAAHRRRRTVTFAPDVSYSCPAEPQHPLDQAVLTFSLHEPGSPLDLPGGSNSSSSGLVGELQVTSADTLDPDLAAAAAVDNAEGQAAGGGGPDAAAAAAAGQHMPEAWRLWFPPALGGVGVPVKQLVKTPAPPRQQQQRPKGPSNSSSRGAGSSRPALEQNPQQMQPQHVKQQQQQQQAEHGSSLPNAPADKAGSSSAAATATAGPAPGTISFKVQTAFTQALSAADRAGSKQQHGPADVVNQQAQARSSAGPSSSTTSSSTTNTAAAAPRVRKFAPTVRPRRSVVVLDDVPGVTVKQRGVRGSSSNSSSNNSSTSGTASQPPAPPPPQQQQQGAAAAESHSASSGASAADASSSSTVRRGPAVPSVQQAAAASSSISQPGGTAIIASGSRPGTTTIISHSSSSSDGSESESDYDEGSEGSDHDWYYDAGAGHHKSSSSSSLIRAKQDSKRAAAAGPAAGAKSSGRAGLVGSDGGSGSDEDGTCDDDNTGGEAWSDGVEDERAEGGSRLQGALQSVLPFLDTKGVTVHLSEFGLMWNTLHGWISPATVAYVNNKHSRQQQQRQPTGSSADGSTGSSADAAAADSAEGSGEAAANEAAGTAAAAAAAAADDDDGDDEEEAHQLPPSLSVVQQRSAMATMLGHALPLVVEQLGIKVPQSELSKQLHALVRSFYMTAPLPALAMHQWQLIVGLMLAALSAWQLPVMRPLFSRQQAGGSMLEVMVVGLGSDVDRFMALLDLFGLEV